MTLVAFELILSMPRLDALTNSTTWMLVQAVLLLQSTHTCIVTVKACAGYKTKMKQHAQIHKTELDALSYYLSFAAYSEALAILS